MFYTAFLVIYIFNTDGENYPLFTIDLIYLTEIIGIS